MAPSIRLDPNPPGQHVALMVTRRCNMTCGHCSVESGPGIRGEPTEAELLGWVREMTAAGVRSIRLTGGEPMLRPGTILRLVRECRRLGVATSLVTNGFWGWSLPRARRQLRTLKRAGLTSVTVSYDRYHADFQEPDPTVHIARAAEELGVSLNINLVRSTDEADLAQIVSRLEPVRGTRIRVYDLQPVGRARDLAPEAHRGEVEGFCTACAFPAVGDDGRVMACNGPAYFEASSSPLVLGSLREESFATLLERHRQDPILDTIRTSGPAGLRDELRRMPGFENFPFRDRYAGICDLCYHVTRNPEAVSALRDRLSQPDAAARRVAAWQVIDGNRRLGTLSPAYVNGIGACRVFLQAAWEPEHGYGPEADRILGRADVDWRRVADYLTGCGLARPLLATLDAPALARWAPEFFRHELRARALTDGLLEAVQREAIDRIAVLLEQVGTRGVLLKGTALRLRAEGEAHRATGDVDLLVDPAVASDVRARLRAGGFEGSAVGGPDRFQHLAPLVFQGVGVEIHTRIMPPFWGLPEGEMLAAAQPLPGRDVLATLSAEGLIVHAAVHSSAHTFSYGLRTAWDLLSVLRSQPDVDWNRVAAWASAAEVPRGFWAPVRVLAEELGLPVPLAFLGRAPGGRAARRIETIARHRLFTATDAVFDLPKEAGLLLLLQEGWAGRGRVLRHLVAKAQWRQGRPRTWSRSDWARRAGLLQRLWRHYRGYRRIMARMEPAVHEERLTEVRAARPPY